MLSQEQQRELLRVQSSESDLELFCEKLNVNIDKVRLWKERDFWAEFQGRVDAAHTQIQALETWEAEFKGCKSQTSFMPAQRLMYLQYWGVPNSVSWAR